MPEFSVSTAPINGTDGDDEILGTNKKDIINGLGGDDRLDGRKGNDILRGGEGDDELEGEDGNDKLIGGAGDDELEGGSGADKLTGGAGVDRFVFKELGDKLDKITDFQPDEDMISIEASSFDIPVGANPTDYFSYSGNSLFFENTKLAIFTNQPAFDVATNIEFLF